ncbi:unnamed protein product [Lactuca saligna]|uniref:Uncharacterized protein n=1 Tax=Lactuca saligna TaxID=75948 RepID=A0AA35YB83_LACSI|nr:unnamed protein product [Lactuca saligna]
MEDICASREDYASNRSKLLPFSPIQSQSFHTAYSKGVEHCRSDRIPMNSNSHGILISSKACTYHHRNCYPKGINEETDGGDFRLDMPARSTPTTASTSHTLNPKRKQQR